MDTVSIASLKLNWIEFLVTAPVQASLTDELNISELTVPVSGTQLDVVPVVRVTDVREGGGISGFTRKLKGATAPIEVPEAFFTELEIPKLYLVFAV